MDTAASGLLLHSIRARCRFPPCLYNCALNDSRTVIQDEKIAGDIGATFPCS
jgi:hypothetical protein